MSNITNSLNNRCFTLPKNDFITIAQKDIVQNIMKIHNIDLILNIKLLDENDEYDSFLVETEKNGFCLKISLDKEVIFYEFMILKGLRDINVSPLMIDRGEIEYGEKLYYTIQSYEYSENLTSSGGSILLTENSYDFYSILNKLHYYEIPDGVHNFLDNERSFLEYEKLNFNSFEEYVSNQEREDFIFTKNLYEAVYNEMMSFYEQFSDKIVTKSLVHGNLNLSTIIENKFNFKFINFENCFYGSPFFDICNLVFEIQMNGINEHDFVSRSIYRLNLSDNRFLSNSYLKEYKICKFIWTRKRLLDLLKNYVKEVIILDKSRLNKILKIGSEFQKHFYRFDTILEFNKNRDVLAKKYHELILNG